MKIINKKKEAIEELKRISTRTNSENNNKINRIVEEIIQEVKISGDIAVEKYTKKFDGFDPNPMQVSANDLKDAWDEIDNNLKRSLVVAHERIQKFHEKEIPQSFTIKGEYGDIVQRRWRPVKNAGIYIPGGRAAYPSTVLMNAIPAKVAGVKEIIICTPPNENGINESILYIAKLLKIDEIYQVGGAQAVAAMAYGTQSIVKVNKIVGPGNIFVAAAKKQVFGNVGIDMIAGPSEVVILSDSNANPKYISNDLLAQAEHDPKASAILVTNSKKLAKKVYQQVNNLVKNAKRKNIIKESLNKNGKIYIMPSIIDCIEFINKFAPEHLEIFLKNYGKYEKDFKNAGSIFVGDNSAEAFGDYIAGPSHVLPTNGNALFSSPLSSLDFIKYSSFTSISKEGMKKLSKNVEIIAESEGLYEHANSVKVRKNK